ncbi:MAG: GNAT family N-acetyltransferase [Thiolinea sp.]
MNTFIQRNAAQNMKAKLNYTWVLPAAKIPRGEKKPVCAYYTLSICHVERQTLPDEPGKRYPNYPLPVFILARLAVDKRCQGQKLGSVTLISALRRCAILSQGGKVPAIAVILDVPDADALQFYQRFGGFRELKTSEGESSRLFIPMKVVEKL